MHEGQCEIFSPGRSQDQSIYAIDGSKDGWGSNEEVLENLKSSILACTKDESKSKYMPIKYFVLLQILKGEDISYITLDECYKLASTSGIPMNEDEINLALEEFNECNVILYFPDILEKIAFIRPEFIFGIVTELISISFHCSNDDINFLKNAMFSEKQVFFRPKFWDILHQCNSRRILVSHGMIF